ncbi:hypothetical protein MMC17_007577 [Xylographa soralifera]|nr:hypothetical protein [Xylographa soralifera]
MSSAEQAQARRKHVLNQDNTVTVFNQQGDSGDTYTYELPIPTPIVPLPGFDVSTVKDQYEKCMAQFQETDYYKKLGAFFESSLLQNSSLPINRIVCLGLGTYSLRSTNTLNSYYQLAAVEVMLELLRRKYTIDDKDVYFQDPLYTEINGSFLALHKFSVLDVPEGYNKITPTTLVYAPVYWEICYHALEVQHPAVWVGENLDRYQPTGLMPSGTQRMKDDKTTIEDFKRFYVRQDMPDEIDDDHNYIGNAIYWEPHTT